MLGWGWNNFPLYQTELFSPQLFLVFMGTIGAVNSPGILDRETSHFLVFCISDIQNGFEMATILYWWLIKYLV